jgi:hypothetical protein
MQELKVNMYMYFYCVVSMAAQYQVQYVRIDNSVSSKSFTI